MGHDALGRLVDWFIVRVSESFVKYRLVVLVMVDHHVAWHIQAKLDERASIMSEACVAWNVKPHVMNHKLEANGEPLFL